MARTGQEAEPKGAEGAEARQQDEDQARAHQDVHGRYFSDWEICEGWQRRKSDMGKKHQDGSAETRQAAEVMGPELGLVPWVNKS